MTRPTRFLIVEASAIAALVLTCVALPARADPSPTPTVGDPIRLMFLGDSITGSPGCWRAGVWANLSDDGYSVDMVGPYTRDECGGVTDSRGNLWDPDHAGYGGITTYGVTAKVAERGLLEKNTPDLIVMLLGTNDVRGGEDVETVLGQYTFLVGLFRQYLPTVVIVVGTLPPIGPDDCVDCQAVLDELNPLLPAWAESVSTPQSPVTTAVVGQDWDVYTDTVDQLHPNASGNAKLAAAWTPAIEAALDDVARRRAEGIPSPSPSPSASARESEGSSSVFALVLGGFLVAGLVAAFVVGPIRARRSE